MRADAASVQRTNLLEDPGESVDLAAFALAPFELATLRLSATS